MRRILGCMGIAVVATAMLTVPYSNANAARVSKYCQGGNHLHYGSGNGRTKKLARRAAIQAWADFTVFEYGSAYGNFKNARFRRTACNKGAGTWSCSVEANPCRRAR